jgi:hypothetical protein
MCCAVKGYRVRQLEDQRQIPRTAVVRKMYRVALINEKLKPGVT